MTKNNDDMAEIKSLPLTSLNYTSLNPTRLNQTTLYWIKKTMIAWWSR